MDLGAYAQIDDLEQIMKDIYAKIKGRKAAKEILEDNRKFEKAYDYQPLTDYNNMMKEEDK